MQKNKLKDLLEQRNPLLDNPTREVIKPVDLYTKPQVDLSTESVQVDKTTNPQVDKTTSKQVVKGTKPQAGKPAKPQVVKYTTHLKPETLKKLRRYAFDHEIKDYEAVQEAVDQFLKGKEA